MAAAIAGAHAGDDRTPAGWGPSLRDSATVYAAATRLTGRG